MMYGIEHQTFLQKKQSNSKVFRDSHQKNKKGKKEIFQQSEKD